MTVWEAALLYIIAALPYLIIILWLLNQLKGERANAIELTGMLNTSYSIQNNTLRNWEARDREEVGLRRTGNNSSPFLSRDMADSFSSSVSDVEGS